MTDEAVIEQESPVVDPVETTDLPESDQADDIEEAATSDDSEDTTAETPKKSRGVQKRIDELTANWRQEQREKEQLLAMLQQMQQQKPEPEPAPQFDPNEPRLDQFEDYDKYVVALAKYEIRKEQEAETSKQKAQAAEQQRRQQEAEFVQKLTDARIKYHDFDYVALDPTVPYSDAMTELVLESEQGADVAYYLGRHKDEALRIAQLDPIKAAREIGKLEVKLSLPQPKTVTKAPNPASTVGSKDAPVKDPSKMSTDEWIEWRNSQLR